MTLKNLFELDTTGKYSFVWAGEFNKKQTIN